jgi:hypothetical protein
MTDWASLPYLPIVGVAPSRVQELLIIVIVLLTGSWTTIVLRYYTRSFIVRSRGWDDHFALLSTIFLTCFCALILVLSYTLVNKTEISPALMTVCTNV